MNPQNKILIGAIIALVLVGGVIAYFLLTGDKDGSEEPVPAASDLEKSLETTAVKKELDNLTLNENPEYFITYNKTTDEFLIVLTPSVKSVEKLNSLRSQAELELISKSNLTKESICSYRVSLIVAPSYWLEYSGIDFGYSSCPGALLIEKQ